MKHRIWFTVTLSSLKKKTSKEVIEKKNKDEKLRVMITSCQMQKYNTKRILKDKTTDGDLRTSLKFN